MLADALQRVTAGDLVAVLGWRADADEQLHPYGPRLNEALVDAARRGTRVRGLPWHSHLGTLAYHASENRELASGVNAAGGLVLLDQRHRALGSHHQKLVVIRHSRPDPDVTRAADVAFLGGIDLAHSRGDDAQHLGDHLQPPFNDRYGRRGTTCSWSCAARWSATPRRRSGTVAGPSGAVPAALARPTRPAPRAASRRVASAGPRPRPAAGGPGRLRVHNLPQPHGERTATVWDAGNAWRAWPTGRSWTRTAGPGRCSCAAPSDSPQPGRSPVAAAVGRGAQAPQHQIALVGVDGALHRGAFLSRPPSVTD